MSTGDECALDWTNPTNTAAFAPPADCRQGSVPPYYVCCLSEYQVSHFVDSHSLIRTDRCTEHERCATRPIFCEINRDDSRYQKYWGELPLLLVAAFEIESRHLQHDFKGRSSAPNSLALWVSNRFWISRMKCSSQTLTVLHCIDAPLKNSEHFPRYDGQLRISRENVKMTLVKSFVADECEGHGVTAITLAVRAGQISFWSALTQISLARSSIR
jgi:hypothetical protein